jgi:Flp pilus assembly protein TadD
MRVRSFSWGLLLVGTMGFWGGGCASRQESQVTLRPAEYRKLLEQQKTGKPVDEALRKELPEMTVGDYEALGDTYLRNGNLTMAFVQYDRALRLEPTSTRIRYKSGLLFLKKELADEALQEFQTVLQQDAQYALAYEGMGQALLKKGQLEEAESSFRKAMALQKDLWQSANFLGMIYDRRQQFDEAIAAYQYALKLRPEQGFLFNNLGLSYYQKGAYEKAVQHLQQALQKGYAQERVFNNLGLALAKLGRYPEALEAFTQGGDKARAYNNVGVVCFTDGKYAEAIAFLQKAVALNPSYYAKANENLQAAQQALEAQGAAAPPVRTLPVRRRDR